MFMQQVKPWQIVLFVLAVAAIAFATWRLLRGDDLNLADSIVMVDVETGELFSFSIEGKRGVGIPNFNPESGKLSLLPVVRDDRGDWRLTERARPILEDLDVHPTAIVDASSGEVKTVGSPRRVSPRSAPGS
jgi:hypothetical protein